MKDKTALEFPFPRHFIKAAISYGDFLANYFERKGKLSKQISWPCSKQRKQGVFKVYLRFTALH